MQNSCEEHFIYLECSQHVWSPSASKPNYTYTIETLRNERQPLYRPKIESLEWLWELIRSVSAGKLLGVAAVVAVGRF